MMTRNASLCSTLSISLSIAAMATMLSFAAQADPPVPGTEDYELLTPHSDWVGRQHNDTGQWCCSIADGRVVEARTVGDHWQVFVTEEKFPGSTRGWHDVPDHVVIHAHNPVGLPIAWIIHDRIYCFAPGSGT